MSPALLPGKLSAEVLPCAILELETGCGRVENTPRLVVVASANKWQVISGEKGRAPPDREGQGGKSAVGFPHLTNRKMTKKLRLQIGHLTISTELSPDSREFSRPPAGLFCLVAKVIESKHVCSVSSYYNVFRTRFEIRG